MYLDMERRSPLGDQQKQDHQRLPNYQLDETVSLCLNLKNKHVRVFVF